MNGLDPAALAARRHRRSSCPTGAPAPAPRRRRRPAARDRARRRPRARARRASSAERIRQIAAEHGAPGSLAAAIAWQESGFNNAMVSAANARGVMQVMPGTWDWVQRNLGLGAARPGLGRGQRPRRLAVPRATCCATTGGDPALAAAGYYQGLRSVRTRGMFDDTRRYVDNVFALRARFGG